MTDTPDELRAIAEAAILPCPFCNNPKIRVKDHGSADFWAHCKKCFADGPMEPTKIEAITAWNTRPSLDRLAALEAERAAGEALDRETLRAAIHEQGSDLYWAFERGESIPDGALDAILAALPKQEPGS